MIYICLVKCRVVSLWKDYLTLLIYMYLRCVIHAVQSNSNHSFAETHPEHNLHYGPRFPQGNQKMTNKTRKGTLCIVDKTSEVLHASPPVPHTSSCLYERRSSIHLQHQMLQKDKYPQWSCHKKKQ